MDQKKEALLDEATELIRELRKKEPKSFASSLNSPFSLMIVGTVLVTIFTTIWQSIEAGHERKTRYQTTLIDNRLESVKNLYESHFQYFQIQDSKFYLSLQVASDRKLESNSQLLKKISLYKKQIDAYNKKIDSLKLPLSDVYVLSALFPSSTIADRVGNYDADLKETMRLLNELAAYINAGEGLKEPERSDHYKKILVPETIEEYKTQREKLDLSLHMLRNESFKYLSGVEESLNLGVDSAKH